MSLFSKLIKLNKTSFVKMVRIHTTKESITATNLYVVVIAGIVLLDLAILFSAYELYCQYGNSVRNITCKNCYAWGNGEYQFYESRKLYNQIIPRHYRNPCLDAKSLLIMDRREYNVTNCYDKQTTRLPIVHLEQSLNVSNLLCFLTVLFLHIGLVITMWEKHSEIVTKLTKINNLFDFVSSFFDEIFGIGEQYYMLVSILVVLSYVRHNYTWHSLSMVLYYPLYSVGLYSAPYILYLVLRTISYVFANLLSIDISLFEPTEMYVSFKFLFTRYVIRLGNSKVCKFCKKAYKNKYIMVHINRDEMICCYCKSVHDSCEVEGVS